MLRVMHIVGAMNRAGVETWLMNLARVTDPTLTEFTFVKHSFEESAYDQEIRQLGHRVVVVPLRGNAVSYVLTLRRVLRSLPRFDAVHAHVGHFSGIALAAGWWARTPVRIAHSHSDSRSVQRQSGLIRRVYLRASSALARIFATRGLASSPEACESLFRRAPSPSGKYQVLPTGIDLSQLPVARANLREELGVPSDTRLICHVGRFVEVKNHELLVDVARVWDSAGPDFRLLLIGDGPLRPAIERKVDAANLRHRVRFLGTRSDILSVLAEVDLVVLPSLYEGVSIVLLEAQASGCPVLMSAHLSASGVVVPSLVTRCDVAAGANEWAQAALEASARVRSREDREAALQAMRSSEYSLQTTLERLGRMWSDRGEDR